MTNKHSKKQDAAPPQLIGVLADALAMGATSFRLEFNPAHIMASFAAGSQATEIDSEARSGQEMLDFTLHSPYVR